MLVKRIDILISIAACLLLLVLGLLTFVDVIGRNVLNRPIAGATELTEFALMAVTFLFYPLAAYHQKNIVVDMLDDFMPVFVKRVQQFVAHALGALLFGLLTWRLYVQGSRLAIYGDVTPYLRLPVAPAYYFMSLLAAITTVAFLVICVAAFVRPVDSITVPNERLD